MVLRFYCPGFSTRYWLLVMLRSEGVMTFWKSLYLQPAGYNSTGIVWGLSCVCDWGWELVSDRLLEPCAGEQSLIFVVPSIMLYSSEISPTRCNNCVFFLRNGFTIHVSGDSLTHHQEYICCIWPQVSRLT